MAGQLLETPYEPRMAPGGFVKKLLSLSSLATLAIVLGMVSWGSSLHAQNTPSTSPNTTSPSQQTPSTQQPPSPEMPPSSQQTPSSQTPSSQTPSTENGSQSSPSQSGQQTPSTQTPAQNGSQSQTPDATAPESGSRTGSQPGAQSNGTQPNSAGTPGASQTFTGTVVKQGDKYVLKDDAGKTYDIDHQSDVAKFEGKRVRVQGTLDPNGKIMVK